MNHTQEQIEEQREMIKSLHNETCKLTYKLESVTKQRDALLGGVQSVESLINESTGVTGLHLNGDTALWNELRTGGRFESWLIAFDEALAASGEKEGT